MPATNKPLNIKEAAEYLGISVQTLYQWVSKRKIPFVKIGSRTMFRESSLQEYIEAHEVQPVQ